MSQPVFASFLADRFMDFITFRRSSGADYRGRVRALSYFDRFLSQQGFNGSYPTGEILSQYVISLNYLNPNTRASRLSVVRQFCLYLRQFEPRCYVPEPGARTGQKFSRAPHIFTGDEIKALLVTAHHLSPQGSLRPMTFYTLFGLLYTTGLRVGEVIACCQQICAVPMKRTSHKTIEYLEDNEIRAVLNSVDPCSRNALRAEIICQFRPNRGSRNDPRPQSRSSPGLLCLLRKCSVPSVSLR